jgi:glycosyltransferase involved in cell wall biosynthesis
MRPRDDILLAGALPGAAAGLSVMTASLLTALDPLGRVCMLTHEISPVPYARRNGGDRPTISLGVQPLTVHGEAVLAGRLHRGLLKTFPVGWAVGSRYAESLRAAGIPYLIWEATTLRDEMDTVSVGAIRRSGRGSGLGTLLYKSLLPLNERLEARAYRQAEGVLALSQYTASRVRALHALDDDKVRVLLPPVTAAFFAALHRARSSRELAGVSGTTEARPVRLLFVGRVDDPRKNFPLLRDAFLRLRRAAVPVTLTVVGPHSVGWRSAQGLDDESGVSFAGSVDHEELPGVLLDHDILVVSSQQEGFGIVVAEAMHAGLAVVSTRCGGPEQVLRESNGGVLVEHTSEALASAIGTLADDPARRTEMGARARAYAERELSAGRFQERVAQELELLRAAATLKSRA